MKDPRDAYVRKHITDNYLPNTCDICGHEYADAADFIKRKAVLLHFDKYRPPERCEAVVACGRCYGKKRKVRR
jgi:hypothetical protein